MSQISSARKKSTSCKVPQKMSGLGFKIFRLNPKYQRHRLNDAYDGADSEGFPIAALFVLLCLVCAAVLICCSF